jgi:hypothetical protein
MTEYLPWWMTAILLAFVTLGFYFANNRTLGVSGSWARVVQWKSDRALDEASAAGARGRSQAGSLVGSSGIPVRVDPGRLYRRIDPWKNRHTG